MVSTLFLKWVKGILHNLKSRERHWGSHPWGPIWTHRSLSEDSLKGTKDVLEKQCDPESCVRGLELRAWGQWSTDARKDVPRILYGSGGGSARPLLRCHERKTKQNMCFPPSIHGKQWQVIAVPAGRPSSFSLWDLACDVQKPEVDGRRQALILKQIWIERGIPSVRIILFYLVGQSVLGWT